MSEGRPHGAIRGMDERELDTITRLSRIGVSLSVERDLDRLLERIVEEVCGFLNADGGTLYLREGDALRFAISRNETLGIRMGGRSGTPVNIPPLPLDPAFVSSYAILNNQTVNIPDVYTSTLFDFTGPKKFDADRKYLTRSMLVVPMADHEGTVIGALQLVNCIDPHDGRLGPFEEQYVILAQSLASQAAVAINNSRLLRETERLFEAFLTVMATGLDARSKYTHGHVRRVAGLTMELARAVDAATDGPFADVHFSENDFRELWIAGWMHDIGKIVSPQHIMDKATKLEGIYDRVALLAERFGRYREHVRADARERQLAALRDGGGEAAVAAIETELAATMTTLANDTAFVLSCNEPQEFMDDLRIGCLNAIRARYADPATGAPLVTDEEMHYLLIRKGSLTDEERKIMQDHIVVTQRMLEKIPFPTKLKNAPLYAGSHHETLDGKGYPSGLTGDHMPLQSRMLCITDFLEALTASDRPYKKAMPLAKAFDILRGEVGRGKLDADLVALLEKADVFPTFQEKDLRGEYAVDHTTKE
ncbi:MAG: GAF domain-containing protein [Nitrospinae bacterium]|nr:GAF domain-containing protein [Nitrospinota bacterium]